MNCIRTINILFFCLSYSWIVAQSGVNIKLGLNAIHFLHEEHMDHAHIGTQLGLDVIAEEGQIFFMPGLHYYRTSIYAMSDEYSWPDAFSHKPNYHGAKVNAYLGKRWIKAKWFKWKTYLGGSANFVFALDENIDRLDDDDYHDVSFALEGGTGIEVLWFTVDLFYQHGLMNVVIEQENSKMRIWGLNVGVFF